MAVENMIRVLAGALVLIAVLLAVTVSPYWLLLAAFVSLNLIQSSFTRFCPAETVLARVLPRKQTSSVPEN